MKKIPRHVTDTYKFFTSSKGAIFYALVLLVFLAGLFYFLLGRGAASDLIDQTLQRQKVVVEAGSTSIINFFDLHGKSLTVLADDPRVKEASDIQAALEDFIQAWIKTPIAEVIYADEEGIVQYVANVEGEDGVGNDVSDRGYFVNLKDSQEGEVFIGDPIRARFGVKEGSFLIPVATPVFDNNGNFEGVIASAVVVSDFTDQYLAPMKITQSSDLYLLNKDGTFLYSPNEEDIGENILTYTEDNPFLGSDFVREDLQKRLESGETGVIDAIAPKNPPDPRPLKRQLVSYAPVNLNGQEWILALRISADDALAFVTPLYVRQIVVFVVVYFALLFFAVRIAKISGFREALKEGKKKK